MMHLSEIENVVATNAIYAGRVYIKFRSNTSSDPTVGQGFAQWQLPVAGSEEKINSFWPVPRQHYTRPYCPWMENWPDM